MTQLVIIRHTAWFNFSQQTWPPLFTAKPKFFFGLAGSSQQTLSRSLFRSTPDKPIDGGLAYFDDILIAYMEVQRRKSFFVIIGLYTATQNTMDVFLMHAFQMETKPLKN